MAVDWSQFKPVEPARAPAVDWSQFKPADVSADRAAFQAAHADDVPLPSALAEPAPQTPVRNPIQHALAMASAAAGETGTAGLRETAALPAIITGGLLDRAGIDGDDYLRFAQQQLGGAEQNRASGYDTSTAGAVGGEVLGLLPLLMGGEAMLPERVASAGERLLPRAAKAVGHALPVGTAVAEQQATAQAAHAIDHGASTSEAEKLFLTSLLANTAANTLPVSAGNVIPASARARLPGWLAQIAEALGRAPGGAAIGATSGLGAQAAEHAAAPEFVPAPDAMTAGAGAGIGAAFASLLGGRGGIPRGARAPDVRPETDPAKMAALIEALRQAGGEMPAKPEPLALPPGDTAIPGEARVVPNRPRPRGEQPPVHVSPTGEAMTHEQSAQALGDMLRQAIESGERPQLPPPTVSVDRAGNALDSAAFMRQLRDALEAAQRDRDLGLTPDVRRAQLARQSAEQDRADAANGTAGELSVQGADDSPPWWLAAPDMQESALSANEKPPSTPETVASPERPKPKAVETKEAVATPLPTELREAIDTDPVLAANKGLAERAATMDADSFVAAERERAEASKGDAVTAQAEARAVRQQLDADMATFREANARWITSKGALRKDTPETVREQAEAIGQRAASLRRAEETAGFDIQQAQSTTDASLRAMHGRLRERMGLGEEGSATGAPEPPEIDDTPEPRLNIQYGKRRTPAFSARTNSGVSGPEALESLSPIKSVEANVRRGQEAMTRALTEKADQHRAMYRQGMGWVDFVWGDSAKGLQHILERRGSEGVDAEQMLVHDLVRTIAQGSEIRRSEVGNSVRAVVREGSHEAVLVRRAGSNAWLLTGFEILPGGEGRSATPSSSTHVEPIRSRQDVGAGEDSLPPDRPRGNDTGIEAEEIAPEDAPPEARELLDRQRQRREAVDAERQQAQRVRQASIERGGAEADHFGLREATEASVPGHQVEFLRDEAGLPDDVRGRLPATNGRRGRRAALFDPATGRVFVFTETVQTPADAAWTVAHEVAGHKGFRALVNDRAGVKIGSRTPIEALNAATDMALQNPTVAKLADVIQRQRKTGNRRVGAEEALAELSAATRTGDWGRIAERYGVDVPAAQRTGVKAAIARFVERLRRILNAVRGKGNPGFSDAQVHQLVADAYEYVREPVPGPRGEGGALESVEPALESVAPDEAAGQARPARDLPRFNRAADLWERKVGAPVYNALSKAVKAVVANDFMKRHGLSLAEDMPAEAKTAWRQYRMDIAQAQKTVAELGKSAEALTPDERALVSDFIEKEMRAGVVPPGHVTTVATMMTSALRKQSADLVELGMLSPEAKARWEGRYLPRFYEKHVLSKPWDRALRAVYLRGIKGSHLKGRGLFEKVAVKDVPKYQALGWELRDAAGKTTDVSKLKPADSVQMWRDFTPEERQRMGEVRDSLYRFARGYSDTQQDIALGRLFQSIADTLGRDQDPGGWVQVPDTTIPRTGVKKFGKLAGKWVPGDVLSELKAKAGPNSDLAKAYLKGLSLWKEGKTSLNPVTHVNNTISNVVMADLAGVNIADPRSYALYAKTFRDYKTKGAAYQEAAAHGLFGGEWFGNEIHRFVALPGQLQQAGTNGNAAAVFARKTLGVVGKGREAMGHLYQAEDQFFKLLLYKQARARGVPPEDAVTWAERWVFDYSQSAPGVRKLKNTLVPFANYGAKAIPALAFAATHYPWRVAKWVALLGGFNLYAFNSVYGDDNREEGRDMEGQLMPDYLRGGSSFFGVPKAIRMPWNDEDTGASIYVDISRFVPMGDLFDTDNQMGGVPLPAPFMPNNPLLTTAYAMMANKDSFTGRELVRDTDTGAEAARKRLMWLYRQMAPNNPLVPGTYNFNRLADAAASTVGHSIGPYTGTDYSGVTIKPGRALAQTFGVKLRTVDLDRQQQRELGSLAGEIRDLRSEARQLMRNNTMPADAKADRLEEIKAKIADRSDRMAKLRDLPARP